MSHKLQTGGSTETRKEDGEKADGNEESPIWHEKGVFASCSDDGGNEQAEIWGP